MSAALIVASYCRTHRLIFSFLQKLSDDQLHWRSAPVTHSIAFHAWHVTRWADHLQAAIPGMTPELAQRLGKGEQLWYSEGLAEHWGLDNAQLGFDATGMHMSDEVAIGMTLPRQAVLLDYIGRVFDLAERATSAIDEQQLNSTEQPQPMTEGIYGSGTVGDALISHVTHASRHLGMMECLLGLQGQRGTATE